MKKGLILLNAYSTLPSGKNQAVRLKEEFSKLGVTVEIRKNAPEIYLDNNGKIVSALKSYDFCVYSDKDKYISELLEKSGVRLFNSHASICACDDKMQTHILLSGHGIPMPATIAGLLCYVPDAEISDETLDKIESTLGYPVIVKTCYGSLGNGVFKADNRTRLRALAEELKCKPHLFQKCITESLGKDIRVIVIGGKVIAAMRRRSETDFRSNIELGGTGTAAVIDENLKALCVRVADVLGLDYCGIDVLESKKGYCICEVNSNAFFGGIEKATGVNVAKAYADYIYGEIYGK